MLDINRIRTLTDEVKTAVVNKGYETVVVDQLLSVDGEWRQNRTALQEAKTASNQISKKIGQFMREGLREEAEKAKAETGRLKGQIKSLEEEARTLESERDRLLLDIPNIAHADVPVGATPQENQVVFTHGDPVSFDFEPVPHWDLVERHDLVDFERGSKVTGGGFPFYKGRGARLQRALVNYFLDSAIDAGYVEMQAPLMINEASGVGTGQIPDKEGQMYGIERDGFFMIPTAEVPLTNYHRDELLEESVLPIRYCGYTPCFRREAGSYGKDVRGLNRLHQFDKVELVHFVTPGTSYDELEMLRQHAEDLLQNLGLPYRRLLMCTGDLGFAQAKKYDLEIWSAGQGRWLEVSSVSNYESFQARRANIRFRNKESRKPEFVHTINGSALAFPRVVAGLLENNQQADGTIVIPEVLKPYTGFNQIG